MLTDFERTKLFKKWHKQTEFKVRTEVRTALTAAGPVAVSATVESVRRECRKPGAVLLNLWSEKVWKILDSSSVYYDHIYVNQKSKVKKLEFPWESWECCQLHQLSYIVSSLCKLIYYGGNYFLRFAF